jgi:hypothetical protein
LLPRPPPDGLPGFVLGPFGGGGLFAMAASPERLPRSIVTHQSEGDAWKVSHGVKVKPMAEIDYVLLFVQVSRPGVTGSGRPARPGG